MAHLRCDFFSESLGLSTSMTVILPQRARGQIGMGSADTARAASFPTLYLLHGMSDDDTIWTRRTSIERYVAELGLAVVMPQVARSFYTDMHAGLRYWTFVSEELPAIARSFFPLSDRREDNFVAGLSMGGYGAFKLALRKPEAFAAAASLSGVLDIAQWGDELNDDNPRRREMQHIFGDLSNLPGSEHDLFPAAKRLASSDGPRPQLYAICGTKDFLYQQNLAFRDHAKAVGLDLLYEEDEGFGHSWDYWDLTIQRVLKWLPLHVAGGSR